MSNIPKLIVLSKAVKGRTYELTESLYVIGRVDTCDICLPDGTVSSHHCELRRQEDGSFLVVDTGSSNGTRINGEMLESRQLISTDILQVGGIELLYDAEDTRAETVMSTQTAINLHDTTGHVNVSETMNNISPFTQEDVPKKTSMNRGKLITAGVLVLGCVAIYIVLRLVIKMLLN